MIKQTKTLQPTSWKHMCEQLDKELGIAAKPNRWVNPVNDKDISPIKFREKGLNNNDKELVRKIKNQLTSKKSIDTKRDTLISSVINNTRDIRKTK